VVEFFRSLSPETIRARYGYLIKDMTPDRAHRLLSAPADREIAIGILETNADGNQRLCAMGRLVHAPDSRGIPRLFAQVRQENRAMLGVFRAAGAHLHFSPNGDVVEVDIPLG
jgi:hypothetical protein